MKSSRNFSMSVAAKVYRLKYNQRYWRQLHWQKDSPTVLIHSPKTGGMSISGALGYKKDTGHFTFKQHLESKVVPVERVIVAVRDPIDRLKSLFKYSRKKSQGSLLAPLRPLRRFNSLQEFVHSSMFYTFVNEHYFFQPQYHFAEGVFNTDLPVFFLRTEHLSSDAKRAGLDNVEQLNKSPKMEDDVVGLDEKTLEIVKRAYEVDELFLDRVYKIISGDLERQSVAG